jgi:hypothetical protein
MTMPAHLTQSAFAAQQGWGRSYVTQLKKEGRLVMVEDGKRVDVAASLARIAATSSPDKRADIGRVAGIPEDPRTAGFSDALSDEEVVGRSDYHEARARRETANAALTEIELRKASGGLFEAAQVESALADAATLLRTSLESMGALLAPQLAAISDEHEIRQTIDDHVHQALVEISDRFAKLSSAEEAA